LLFLQQSAGFFNGQAAPAQALIMSDVGHSRLAEVDNLSSKIDDFR
jgi:hypothetical protein